MKNIFKKAISLLLTISTILSMGIMQAHAETISDGQSTTVTVAMGTRNSYLATTGGNTLNGMEWTYTTNTGLQGPAYCVDWGLAAPSPSKELTISGQFISNPKTMGAFATGHPQRALGDFLNLYLPDNPKLAGLTHDEYAYSTQVAVWATLGQIAIDGTDFNEGRARIAVPYNDAQQMRVYTAIKIILFHAANWSKPMKTSMEIRNFKDRHDKDLYLEHENGLAGIAANNNESGVKIETINNEEYYTREFTAASGTSTWHNGYNIDLSVSGASSGTILVNENNEELAKNGDTWKLPTNCHYTWLNDNGEEYWGTFKLCIPVRMTEKNGEITIYSSATVAQHNIYLANNTDYTEQSYVLADRASLIIA